MSDLAMPEPVVILGGGGFIGSNLGERLHKMGYDVQLVDINFEEWRWSPKNKRHYHDLRSFGAANGVLKDAGTVFHFAADMGGVEYFHSDKDFGAAMNNGLITNTVLRAAVNRNVPRLIYASSACAAATQQQMIQGRIMWIHEDDIEYGDPDARYGAEKRYGAYMVANAPLDGRVGIFHTIYGPGQEHEGVRMKFPSAVATGAIKSLQTDELVLFGNGKQIRTYLYIDDAVDRIVQLAEAPPETFKTFRTFNIGAETPVTCREVAETCLDIVGSDATIKYNPGKPSGVLGRGCRLSRWERHFGVPHETSIQEGFEKFIDWLEDVGVQ